MGELGMKCRKFAHSIYKLRKQTIMDEKTKVNFAFNSFEILEKQLIECMEFLPFIEENKDAISPKFISIIMDSCSLIESVFSDITSSRNKERLNFKEFYLLHESKLSLEQNISLLLILPIQKIRPYEGWNKKPPVWWNAYNKIKHDRLNNYHYATYSTAVNSLAGLHQLISKHSGFIREFLRVGWIDTNSIEVTADLSSHAHEGSMIDVIVESKLFASPSSLNFINPLNNDNQYIGVDNDAIGLSQRLRNLLFAHEDF